MQISQVLEDAIGNLWGGVGVNDCFFDGDAYSCHAIQRALPLPRGAPLPRQITDGLRNMGLNPGSANAFREIPLATDRQQARALWLTWAALMAEEQGL